MTAKEKARELVRQYWDLGNMDILKSKVCALIAVDEMYNVASENDNVQQMNYLVDVKREI